MNPRPPEIDPRIKALSPEELVRALDNTAIILGRAMTTITAISMLLVNAKNYNLPKDKVLDQVDAMIDSIVKQNVVPLLQDAEAAADQGVTGIMAQAVVYAEEARRKILAA